MKKKPSEEFQKFDNLMHQLISVPHEEIKRQLDAEKAEKKKRKANPSASDPESHERD